MSREWNEIEFLSWREFRQMAPSIIQLEITRIGNLIDQSGDDTDFRNRLVKARYELRKFTECLNRADKTSFQYQCSAHLQTAVLTISVNSENLDQKTAETLQYILERLRYVNNRIQLIY